MKATLEFDLTDAQQKSEFEVAVNGMSAHITLWDLDQHLRSKLKYEELSDPVHEALQAIRDKLRELCEENEVNLDNLL